MHASSLLCGAVRELAMTAVDLAPRFGQAQDRSPFPVQQGVHRAVWSRLGVREPVVQGPTGPAQDPGVLDPQEGSRASQ